MMVIYQIYEKKTAIYDEWTIEQDGRVNGPYIVGRINVSDTTLSPTIYNVFYVLNMAL